MGTHPIFEADFDCLTEMEEAIVDPGPDELPAADPVEQPQQPTQNMDAVFSAHTTICNFLAANGWYIVFGVAILSIVWKNLEKKVEKARRMYQDAQIKKNPDTYQKQEEDRMARLERLQKQYDEKAVVRAEREKEIEAARKERDQAAAKLGGKESLKRWEEEKNPKSETENKTTGATQRKKPSTFKRAEFNPLMGSGGGGGFKSSRPKRSGGG